MRIGRRELVKNKAFLCIVSAFLAFTNCRIAAFAGDLPEGAVVQAGNAAITSDGTNMTVATNAAKTWIDWQGGVNIGAANSVNNIAAEASAVILHHDISGALSSIQGALTANCNVFLLNPSGILFGSGAQVNVGGLVVSTLNMSLQDFISGNYILEQDGDNAGLITNLGEINATGPMGVTMAAGAVKNEGVINAGQLGTVNLVSGSKVTLNADNEGLIQVTVDGKVLDNVYDKEGNKVEFGVDNVGEINANGGKVYIEAEAAQDVFSKLINQEGVVNAGSMVNKNGKIVLVSKSEGVVENSGTLNTSAVEAGADGGSISISGEKIGQLGTVKADAKGDGNGGTVDITSTQVTVLGPGSITSANADQNGNGGDVKIWSDNITRFYGAIETKGGLLSGNGGFVEVSGNVLSFNGSVDATAPYGLVGTLLLDPSSLTIVAGASGSGGGDLLLPDIYKADTFTPETVSEGALEALSAVAVILEADGDITISSLSDNILDLSDCSSLTIRANYDNASSGSFSMGSNHTITVGGAIDISGASITTYGLTSTGGGITLRAWRDSAGSILSAGTVSTNGGAFTVTYGLAAGASTFTNTGTISTSNGAIDIQTTGAVSIGANWNPGNGLVTIDGGGSGVASITNSGGTINMGSGGLEMLSAGSIGSAGTPVATTGLADFAASSSGGGVFISNAGSGNAVITTVDGTSGVTAGNGNISLSNSAGSINGIDDGAADITATGNVTLSANGIGNSAQVEIGGTASNAVLTLTDSGSNNVNIQELADLFSQITITQQNASSSIDIDFSDSDVIDINGGTPVTINSVVTSSGNENFTYTLSASANLSVNSVNTGTASSSITASAGTLTVAASGGGITATGTGDVTLAASGNIIVNDSLAAGDDISITSSGGAVTVNDTTTSADDTTITASGNIETGTSGLITGDLLTLTTTGSGSTIGTVLNTSPLSTSGLSINAVTVTASTNEGHIIITDTAGGIAVYSLDTNDADDSSSTRVILEAVGGAITAAAGSSTNIDSWAANLVTSESSGGTHGGAIGASGDPIETAVSVFSATADNGGIYLYQPSGDLILGSITAKSEGRTPYKNDSGYIVVATSGTTTSDFDIEITGGGDIFLSGVVTSPDSLTISAVDSIADSHDGTDFIADTLTLTATNGNSGIGIGQSANPLETLVQTVNATSGNYGVYLSEGMGIIVGTITANGTDNDVSVTASTGSIALGQIDTSATADAVVTLESTQGSITDNNGATVNILTSGTAGTATITAEDGIGTSSNDIETTVAILSATTSTADTAGIYISETNALSSITASVNDSVVDIHYVNSGAKTLNFNATYDLSLSDSGLTTLTFSNTGSDIDLAGVTINTSGTATITAEGAITQNSGTLTAGTAALSAGTNIGASGNSVATAVSTLTAVTTNGSIYIQEADGVTLDATAAGTSKDIVVATSSGDITLNTVTATQTVNLSANGSILDNNGATNNISGTAAVLNATNGAVGSSGNPIETQIAGTIDVDAATGAFITNIGDVTQFDADVSGGNLTFNNTGSAALGAVDGAANTVTLNISGAVTDANAGTLNITASSLVVDAKSFGTASDVIETDVSTFTRMDTTSGGIYVQDTVGNVVVTDLEALGSGANISFTSAGNITLSSVTALGDTVTLVSGGNITDGNGSATNVTAYTLDITATGTVDDLELAVSVMTGSASSLTVVNQQPIKITASTLSGSNVNITADDITIFDNGGGTTTTGGGSLTLIALYGDIVFLNTSDTIRTSGDITLTALYDGDASSAPARIDNEMAARIIAGNLTSTGNGTITLTAYSDITIGLLDAGTGTVNVRAAGYGLADYGLILDGNGSSYNIVAGTANLYAKMHSATAAEIDRENALARYEAAVAEANAAAALQDTWESNYNDYVNLVAAALAVKNNAQAAYNSALSTYNSENSKLSTYSNILLGLSATRTAAQIVKNACSFPSGAAQAVPLTGDGGAATAQAAVELVFSIADAAMLAYEEAVVNPQENTVANASSARDQAASNLQAAINDYNNLVAARDAANNSLGIADSAYNAAVIAREHSQAVRTQALASDSAVEAIGSDAATGASGQLEINARTVNVTTAGTVTTGPAASNLTNATTVTLDTVGDVNITNNNTSGLTTVNLQTDSDINYTQTGNQNTLISYLGTTGSGSTITVTNAAGEVYGSNDGSADIVAPNIDITAASVGQTAQLEVNATSSLSVNTSGSNGNINIEDTVGSLPIGTINAGAGDVTLINSTGQIYDASSDSVTDITAHELSLTAGTGIGSTAALETAVSVYAATTVSGDIVEYNSGGLIIGTLGSLVGVTITGGGADDDIFIQAASPLTINSPVTQSGGGDITLVADGTTSADILTINNTVTASGGNGNIYLYAGNDIVQNDFAVTAAGSGSIRYYAGVDYNSGSPQAGLAAGTSDITMSASGSAVSTSGNIILTAPRNITIGSLSTSGNVSVTADDSTYITSDSVGAISESAAEGTANITAATATLRSATGIGSSDDIETNITTLDALNTTSGNISIYELAAGGALNVNRATQQTTGNVDIQTANGTLTIVTGQNGVTAAGTGTVTLVAGDSDNNYAEDLAVNASVNSNSGKITLTSSGNDVLFSAAGDITSVSGEIEVNAVSDSGDGAITMSDGAVINSGSGVIDLNADVDITIGGLVTTASSNTAVTIDSAEGALVDGGDTNVDIIANSGRAVIRTVTGAGSSNALETTLGSIDITNALSGNIQIDETDAITIVNATQSTTGNISITAAGTITADSAGSPVNVISTLSNGTIVLDANGTSSSIVVNDGISSASGNITLTADDDVTFAAEGDITSTSGAVSVTADADGVDNGSSGALTMADGALINAGSGTIALRADENITLGGLLTTNATSSAVAITSTSGAVVDGGDTHTDITANAVGAVVTIDAVTGVGSSNALETAVDTIDIDNTPATSAWATGNIKIIELAAGGDLTVQRAVQGDVGCESTNRGNIDISTVDGSITVSGVVTVRDGGTITIDANDAGGDDSRSLTVNAAVTSSVGLKDVGVDVVTAGNITLSADEDVNINAKVSNSNANADYTANGNIYVITDNGDVNSAAEIAVVGTGSVYITAGDDALFSATGDINAVTGEIEVNALSSGGLITMSNGAVFNAGSGIIDLNADGDITLGSLQTTSTSVTAGSEAVNINSAAGGIIDGGDTDVDVVAASGRLVIDSYTGVGVSNAIDTTVGSLDIDNAASGAISINETDAVTVVKAVQATTGDINIVSGGTMTIDSAGSPVNAVSTLLTGTILLDANGAASDIVVNDGISSASGTITLTADNDVIFAAEGDIASTSGNVTVTADADNGGTASGALTMADGTLINAGSARIALNADEDITLGGLLTTNTSTTAVVLTSTEGGIVDGGDTDVDVVAASGRLVIDTVTGVGVSNAIDTTIASLDVDNSTSGAIKINETNALTVVKAVQATTGDINIVSGGTMTIDSAGSPANAVSTLLTGTILLDANGAASDIVVNDGISSASGAITLTADNDVIFAAEGDIASTSGNVTVTADADNGGTASGALTMNDATLINAGSGSIALNADEDITLGGLLTTNTSTTAVVLTSTEGGIVDGGDTYVDVVAASGRLVIDSTTGVGVSNAIDTTVGSLDIDNSTSGMININETDAVTVAKAVQATTGDILIVSGGTLTVDSAGSPVNAVSTLTASTITLDANGAASNIVVNDGISSASGAITLTADNNVIFAAEGDITSTSGNVTVTADADNGANGAITMADGALINSGSARIDMNAYGDITLGGLITTNAGDDAVTVTSTAGGIIDGGDSHIEITANSIGAIVDLDAATGIGSDNPLEIKIYSLEADNSTSGNIKINESDSILLSTVVNHAPGSIEVEAGGTITTNTLSALNGAVNLNSTGGDLIDVEGGLLTASTTTELRASGLIGTIENPYDVNITSGGLWVWAGSQNREVSANLRGIVVSNDDTERVEIFTPAPPGLVLLDSRLMGGANYGSGSANGSILSRGYGYLDLFRSDVTDSAYARALEEPWGYKLLLPWSLPSGAKIDNDFLSDTPMIIDASLLNLPVLYMDISKSMDYYVIRSIK